MIFKGKKELRQEVALLKAELQKLQIDFVALNRSYGETISARLKELEADVNEQHNDWLKRKDENAEAWKEDITKHNNLIARFAEGIHDTLKILAERVK